MLLTITMMMMMMVLVDNDIDDNGDNLRLPSSAALSIFHVVTGAANCPPKTMRHCGEIRNPILPPDRNTFEGAGTNPCWYGARSPPWQELHCG